MGKWWFKTTGNSDREPRKRRSGFWGQRVYEALCRTSAEFELEGRVPRDYCDPAYLADRLQAYEVLPGKQAEAAIAAALRKLAEDGIELVEPDDDGGLVIIDWGGITGENSTPRVQKHRDKKRQEAMAAAVAAAAEAAAQKGNVPAAGRNKGNVSSVPGTRSDQSRSEKKKDRSGDLRTRAQVGESTAPGKLPTGKAAAPPTSGERRGAPHRGERRVEARAAAREAEHPEESATGPPVRHQGCEACGVPVWHTLLSGAYHPLPHDGPSGSPCDPEPPS